jgi:hypothetical protein
MPMTARLAAPSGLAPDGNTKLRFEIFRRWVPSVGLGLQPKLSAPSLRD